MLKNALSKKPPAPPAHLSPEARGIWLEIVADYDVSDSAGRLLLATALEAFDRMRACAALIEKHGEVFRDKWRQLKANPAVAAEHQARNAMLTALRQLNLDIDPTPKPMGRPPGGRAP